LSTPSGTLEASTHYSPSTITITPGARIKLTGLAWGCRRLAILSAGPIANKMCRYPSGAANIARHEACHVTIQFLLGAGLEVEGASIIPVAGHSAGRASNRLPPPGDQSLSDERQIADLKLLGGAHFDLDEIEQFVTAMLFDYMPLVLRLAAALVEHRVLTARRCRQILFRALRKDLRRARALAERDRREQAAFAVTFQKELRT
jgi:hypothetical protein